MFEILLILFLGRFFGNNLVHWWLNWQKKKEQLTDVNITNKTNLWPWETNDNWHINTVDPWNTMSVAPSWWIPLPPSIPSPILPPIYWRQEEYCKIRNLMFMFLFTSDHHYFTMMPSTMGLSLIEVATILRRGLCYDWSRCLMACTRFSFLSILFPFSVTADTCTICMDYIVGDSWWLHCCVSLTHVWLMVVHRPLSLV